MGISARRSPAKSRFSLEVGRGLSESRIFGDTHSDAAVTYGSRPNAVPIKPSDLPALPRQLYELPRDYKRLKGDCTVTTTGFDGASAIVTGGTGGLGEATVRRLHREGLGVVIADIADDKGKALAAELGERAAFVHTDVGDDDTIAEAIREASRLGTLRYAVVAHGGGGAVERIVGRDGAPARLDTFKQTIDGYLTGSFNAAQLTEAAVAAATAASGGERGALVLTASIAGYEGQIGQSAYTAAKGGIICLTLVAARDLGSLGIRVNTIAPGTMKTPIMESVGDEALAKLTASVPFPKRLGAPEEHADAVVFLLRNGYVNG